MAGFECSGSKSGNSFGCAPTNRARTSIKSVPAYYLTEGIGSQATTEDAEAFRAALLSAGYTEVEAVPEAEWLRIMGEACQ